MSLHVSPSSNSIFRAGFSFPRCLALVIFTALLASTSDSYASVTDQFIRLTTFPSGGVPVAVASADFNRDRKADVAVLNSNGVLSLLLGAGNATFAAAKNVVTLSPVPASFLTAADFNGDSNEDLLLLQSAGNAITVYPGHGDGTFGAPVKIGVGVSSAGNVAIGDFNGDLRPDVAVANNTSVAVLLGKAGGYFQTPIIRTTDISSDGALVMGLSDVNRDGHLDAVVTDLYSIQVLLGNGHGGFNKGPISDPPPGYFSNALAVADFDLDGKPDLAFYDSWDGQACLASGNGDGTFGSGPCFPMASGGQSMQVSSLNGKPGLVVEGDPMYVLLTSAPGKFSKMAYAAGGGPVAFGDFNGDGRQDVLASNDHGVEVLLNAGGAGVLLAPTNLILDLNQSIWSMVAADFNGDGFSDLAVEQTFQVKANNSPSIGSFLGAPANRMNPTANISVLQQAYLDIPYASPPAIADFNHDGHLDIAYNTIETPEGYPPVLQVLFGDGKGGFPARGPELEVSSNFIAAGYFNAGGYGDLASLNGPNLEILLGRGNGTFAPPIKYQVGTNPVFVLQRDLNNDGKRDLVVVNQGSDNISVLLGNGDGTFKPQKTFASGTFPNWAATGDFNRDGRIDLAVASAGGISVLLGKGDGTFQLQKTYSATGPVLGIVQASVRQDGIECLLAIASNSRFVLLPGVGDGTFRTPVFFPVDHGPWSIVAGDFNRDGATDIALLSERQVEFLYNQGGDYVSLSSSSTTPKTGQPITLTALVTPGYGEIATVSGKVTFKDGSKYLGTVSLQGRTASITTQFPAGTHQIQALYGGNASLNPNHAPTLAIVVQ